MGDSTAETIKKTTHGSKKRKLDDVQSIQTTSASGWGNLTTGTDESLNDPLTTGKDKPLNNPLTTGTYESLNDSLATGTDESLNDPLTTRKDESLNDPVISLSTTHSDQTVSMTTNTNGSTIEASFSATYTPPAKRARHDIAAPQIEKGKPVEQLNSVTKDAVAKSTTQEKRDSPVAKEVDECPICFQGYGRSDEKKFLPCAHSFHENCVNKWLRAKNSCPICRNVTTDASIPAAAGASTADNFLLEVVSAIHAISLSLQRIIQSQENWREQLLEQVELLDQIIQRLQ